MRELVVLRNGQAVPVKERARVSVRVLGGRRPTQKRR
jgi:hypothetical protein